MAYAPLDRAALEHFFTRLSAHLAGPAELLICGGVSALMEGWRGATIDIDLSYFHEPAGLFEALARLRAELDIAVDLVAPTAFVPALPGAAGRHRSCARYGSLQIRHFDFYTQALGKLQRAHARDLADVAAMRDRGLIDPGRLRTLYREVQPQLIRYPAIEPAALDARVDRFCRESDA